MKLLGIFVRFEREKKTVSAMIKLYCREVHKSQNLCCDCQELKDYALLRLDKCPFGYDKPICNKCTIHCFSKEMREKIREVMRFAGPRMITKHPILALFHIWDSKIEPKILPKKALKSLNS